MPKHRFGLTHPMRLRVAVVLAAVWSVDALIRVGLPPIATAITILAAIAAGIALGCRLTTPYDSPRTKVIIVIVILALVSGTASQGWPPVCIAVVLGVTWCAIEAARWLIPAPRTQSARTA